MAGGEASEHGFGEVFEGQEFRDDNWWLQVSIFGSPSSGELAPALVGPLVHV